MSQTRDVIVLGGGLAGLTFAMEATRLGKRVAVLESAATVGGLSRTLAFGDYRFDLGGHRFHSQWPEIRQWVQEVLGDNALQVVRRSRIHLNGRYVDYPLQFPGALTAFSPPRMVQMLASYLFASLRHRNGQDVTFESWVVRRYGRALYDVYFRPYTEKVWGISCSELSADWASQRIQLPSLAAAIKGSLLRGSVRAPTLVSRFLYPTLGIGVLPERLAEKAQATGRAAIHLGSRVTRLEHDGPEGGWRVCYEQAGRQQVVAGRQVVSTIPLTSLLAMLPANAGVPPPLVSQLEYRGLICVFMAIDGPRLSADTWTYFPDCRISFGRTHEPPNWSPAMAPEGKTSLCAEIFCSPGEPAWQRPDGALIESVSADLAKLGIVARDRIRDAWLARVPDAYPCYRVGYAGELRSIRRYLTQRFPTLHLLGRTGAFQYLNMDAVIRQALDMAGVLGRGGEG